MHRAVLQACLPWFIALCVASAVALLLVQYCGGRRDWRRLTRLRHCEDGAVQSLSLVLTLPLFLMLLLFIVQVTQIMAGIMMVNYAAFAAARSASVWIPAEVTKDESFQDPPFDFFSMLETLEVLNGLKPNTLFPNVPRVVRGSNPKNILEPANVLAGVVDGSALPSGGFAMMNATNGVASHKYQKVVLAAVIPCLTVSPSRQTNAVSIPSELQDTYQALLKLYPIVDPASKSNPQIPRRLRNKLAYAAKHTTVDLIWQNVAHPLPDIIDGPTYNPYDHPDLRVKPWNPNEIGFRDPVTVVVKHQFALLPGIGRLLSRPTNPLNSSQPMPLDAVDRVASRISQHASGDAELYTIELEASATFVNEGFKSVFRYAVQPESAFPVTFYPLYSAGSGTSTHPA